MKSKIQNQKSKIIILLLIFSLVWPSFCLAQGLEQPKTLDEAKSVGFGILKRLPEAVKDVWNNQAIPIWQGMWQWAQGPWETYVKPRIESSWNWFINLLGKKTPEIKEEFQKEKQEMQKDLWQRFKDLL